jgi:hypothetical protein
MNKYVQVYDPAALLLENGFLIPIAHEAVSGSCGVEKICYCRESNAGRPAYSPSLYRLSYSAPSLGEIGWSGVDWIDPAQDREKWRALMNAVMNLRVLKMLG